MYTLQEREKKKNGEAEPIAWKPSSLSSTPLSLIHKGGIGWLARARARYGILAGGGKKEG